MSVLPPPVGVTVDVAPGVPGTPVVLTREAMAFVAGLHRYARDRRVDLLDARQRRRATIAATGSLDFLPTTRAVREGDWQVAPTPADLLDRRAEITGPTDRKMAINALNSGARVWMADFEDSSTPTWENVVQGQLNLMDAIDGTIDLQTPQRHYRIEAARTPTIVVRPRGWHLVERHMTVDGEPVIAGLFDFGMYLFHNARRLSGRGSGPYFYLPKLESHLEARLWNDVFVLAQERLMIPVGTIRATVLIETILAAFEMEEILYELRDHASGLNAGRWDYLFSLIKTFRDRGPEFVLPDRNAVRMDVPMMRAYTTQLVRTCHRRGAHAIGGMAAYVPNRRDPERNATAMANVRKDKQREAGDGFDGSWVAHPDMVGLCTEVFDAVLGESTDQRQVVPPGPDAEAAALLDVAATPGEVTEAGLRNNVSVSLQYLESWLRGSGAVAIFDLMEDVATAEIARSQVWHWIHHAVLLPDGRPVTGDLVRRVIDEELATVLAGLDEDARLRPTWVAARSILEQLVLGSEWVDFLTLATYAQI